MEFVVTLLVAFAFGAAAKKKGREGLKWGAGLAAVLFIGVSAIGFYGQAARLSGAGIDSMATWYWLIVVCAAAAIYLYSLDGKVAPTTPAASVYPAEVELQTHRVVLEGRALEGQEIGQVAARLGQLFKRPTEQLVSLLQGKPTVLKRGLDEATARRYQAAVQQAGAACRVEREQPAVDASVPSTGERSAASAEKPVQRSAWGNIKHYGAIGVGLVVLASGLWQFGSKMMGSAPVGDAPDSVKIASPATKAEAPKVAALPPKQSAVPDDYATLLDAATRYITEWNTDPNTRLCDEIASPGLTDVQKGKVIFIAMGGGKVDPPIPAIVARITGTCVQAAMRQREPMPKVWMMMAHDKAFNQYHCIKVGGDHLVRNFAGKGCEFVPNPGESGLIQVRTASSEQPTPASTADTPQSGAMPTFAKGESYTSVRLKMLGAGWKPYHSKDADTCGDGDSRCKDRPEMEACSGTGLASCTFLWTRSGKAVAIVTTGEAEAVFADLQDRSAQPAPAAQAAPSAAAATNAAAFCSRPPNLTFGALVAFQNNITKATSLGSSCEIAASLAAGKFRAVRDMWQSGEALQRAGASGAGNYSQACEWAVEGNEALKKECPQVSR